MTDVLTTEDLEFLARPLYGIFTPAAGPMPPQPRPVWFETSNEGAVQLFSEPDAVKVRRLRRDPRASLVVTAPVGERERWVSVGGPTSIETNGARELLERLAVRYWDLDDPVRAGELSYMLTADWVRIVIHPEKVFRYTM